MSMRIFVAGLTIALAGCVNGSPVDPSTAEATASSLRCFDRTMYYSATLQQGQQVLQLDSIHSLCAAQ